MRKNANTIILAMVFEQGVCDNTGHELFKHVLCEAFISDFYFNWKGEKYKIYFFIYIKPNNPPSFSSVGKTESFIYLNAFLRFQNKERHIISCLWTFLFQHLFI